MSKYMQYNKRHNMSKHTRTHVKNGTAWRKRRAYFKSLDLPCAICGKPIDYTLKGGDPLSFELDHICPVSRWKEAGYISREACELDRENLQPTHRICNGRKGNGRTRQDKSEPIKHKSLVTSRAW